MVDRIGVHRADEAHLINHFGGVRQEFGNPHAGFAMLLKLEFGRSDGKAGLARGHRGKALPHADRIRKVFVVPFLHHRFVVVQIHLRRTTDHVQINHMLGLGGKVRQARKFVDGGGNGTFGSATSARHLSHQGSERGSADAPRPLGKEMPTG